MQNAKRLFYLEGNKVVSCGMDHSLKIWKLDKRIITDTIEKSNHYDTRRQTSELKLVFRLVFIALVWMPLHA